MPKPATVQARRELLRRAKRTIRARSGEFDLALADVAADLGVSSRQLQRVFGELAGEDFRGYLLRVRMTEAARRLRRGETVRATAPRVGYRQPSGLRQAFLRFYGINPSALHPEPPHYLGSAEWSEDGTIQ
jgi:AraC-like DNA-binding protein